LATILVSVRTEDLEFFFVFGFSAITITSLLCLAGLWNNLLRNSRRFDGSLLYWFAFTIEL
jgi:hypothetical protein